MTDTSIILKNSYNGNGSATNFDYQFKIYNESELTVIKTGSNGVNTTLILNTDYSVTGVGNNNGGSITYPLSGSALASGEKITLYPSYSLTQTIDFTNQDKAYFELFEEGLDRSNLKIKMLQEQIDRAIKVGITSTFEPEDYLGDTAAYADQASQAASEAQASADAASASAASINLPTDLSSQSLAFLRVKSDESGYEFTTSAPALVASANTFTANQTISATLDANVIKIGSKDITPHFAQGQCRLDYVSATQVKLKRHNGKSLMLWDGDSKWVSASIPSTGITYTITGAFDPNTLYYIYAYLDSGVTSLAGTTTAPAIDSDSGYMILPTSDKYLCVGMLYTNASTELDDEFMVLSYFNRRPKTKRAELSANATTTSTSYIEASSDLRCPFLIWEGDEALAQFNMMQYTAAASIVGELFMSVDGTTTSERVGALYQNINDGYSSPKMASFCEQIRGKAQGHHYATIIYATSNASYATTLYGSSGRVSNLNITIMG